jgi:chromosome segregation ATPase
MDNHNGGHSLSSGSSHHEDEYAFYEQASNREKELQEQLDAAKKELEEERESVWLCKSELQLALSSIEREVCEYKNQLVLVKNSLESEHRDWEMVRARLETQVERERLKVRARDVQIHELKLSKEQEIAALTNQLVTVRNHLETENRSLREQLRQFMSDSPNTAAS